MLTRVRSSWPVLGAWLLVAAVSAGYALLCCAVFWVLGLSWWWGLVPTAVSLVGAEAFQLLRPHGPPPSQDTDAIGPENDPRLHAVLDRLCALSGQDKPVLRRYDADSPNAVTYTGRGEPETVYLSRGLLERLDNQELEAVLAHELAHLAHRDQRVLTFATVMGTMEWALTVPGVILLGLSWVDARLCALAHRCGQAWRPAFDGPEGRREVPAHHLARPFPARPAVVVLVLTGLTRGVLFMTSLAVILPVLLAAVLVYAAISFPGRVVVLRLTRRRELAADRAAAELTGAPSTLAAALTRMAAPVPEAPDEDLRGLRIVAPLAILPFPEPGRATDDRSGAGSLWARLRSTHPPVHVRVSHLQRISARTARR
ncbi:M48 family metalloprotease [Nocardiopsis aegyptia]|uniref:M48 family metalloprotease n=1 Tax=Nocardiopsis aegyptia TaxID=220378 RepID=UPI00366C090A